MISSVSGGSHWGGGVEIHAEDQARIGQLMLHRGVWERAAAVAGRLDRGIADPVRAQSRATGCSGG